jgi:hypothetical protein
MIYTATRAKAAETWGSSTVTVFEFEPASRGKDEANAARRSGRGGGRAFASASAALSDGVICKPAAPYAPPPPKPKVCLCVEPLEHS